jgi:hypothetical protein
MKNGIFILTLFLFSCQNKKNDNVCFIPYFVEPVSNEITSYVHYIFTKNINSDSILLKLAKNYIGTLHDEQPVSSIRFISDTSNISRNVDDQDFEVINKQIFVEYQYYYENGPIDYGKFKKIVHWKNGNQVEE